MMYAGLRILILTIVLILLQMAGIYSQENGSSVPLPDVCRSMMDHHQKGDFDGIKAALPYLEPFLDSLQRELNIDLHEAIIKAIRSEDPDAFVLSLRKVILCDIYLAFRTVMTGSGTSSPGRLKAWHKISYGQYFTLIAGAESRDNFFKINRRIKKAYKVGYSQLRGGSPYRDSPDVMDTDMYLASATRVLEQCLVLFPELGLEHLLTTLHEESNADMDN